MSIDLKKQLNDVSTLEEMASIVNRYDLIDRKELKGFIKVKVEDLLELQNNLTTLEAF